MNRFYIITPLVLMAAFGVVFWQHSKSAAVKEKAEIAIAEKVKAETEAKKKQAIDKAREDGEKRAAARLAEEQQKEAEKQAKWKEAGDRIDADIAANKELFAKNSATVKALESELETLRTSKESINNKMFSMMHETETERIAKRSAELEIQRLTEIVARTAANTSLVSNP